MKIDELNMLQNKLPDTPGINGKDEYFNSVVLLLLIPKHDEYHIVFEKRSLNMRQGGEICLPGGKYEKETDVSLEIAALRETYEELGIPDNRIEILGRLDTVIAPMGATIDVFLGVSDIALSEITINPAEVEKVFTLPVSYFEENIPEEYKIMIELHPSYIDKKTNQNVVLLPAEELGLPERYRVPWGDFKHKIYAYKTTEGVIWGITARIILDFINKLKDRDIKSK